MAACSGGELAGATCQLQKRCRQSGDKNLSGGRSRQIAARQPATRGPREAAAADSWLPSKAADGAEFAAFWRDGCHRYRPRDARQSQAAPRPDPLADAATQRRAGCCARITFAMSSRLRLTALFEPVSPPPRLPHIMSSCLAAAKPGSHRGQLLSPSRSSAPSPKLSPLRPLNTARDPLLPRPPAQTTPTSCPHRGPHQDYLVLPSAAHTRGPANLPGGEDYEDHA